MAYLYVWYIYILRYFNMSFFIVELKFNPLKLLCLTLSSPCNIILKRDYIFILGALAPGPSGLFLKSRTLNSRRFYIL